MKNKTFPKLPGIITLMLFACMILFLPSCSHTEASGMFLRVTPYPDSPDSFVSCVETAENEYSLFLPAGTDRQSLYVDCGGQKTEINGEILPDGGLTGTLSGADEFIVNCKENSFTLKIYTSENLPAIFIQTDEKGLEYLHEDKENKLTGTITVINNGTEEYAGALKYIKGRGNSTWQVETDKRPYNIKLDKSSALLGMSKAKKWRLLANAMDETLIKNTVALKYAAELGVEYAVGCQQVDLYINGDYRGNYLLTEAIEPGEGRVEVADTDKLNEEANAPALPETFPLASETDENGYLTRWRELPAEADAKESAYILELDEKNELEDELCIFHTPSGRSVALKTPEYASESQVKAVSSLMCAAENAVYSDTGYNADGQYYADITDVDSLAKAFLLHEFMVNPLGCSESMFFTVPAGENRIHAGPVWDFDLSSTEWNNDRWLCPTSLTGGVSLFSAAFRHGDFREKAAEIWNGFFSAHPKNTIINDINNIININKASAAMDRTRWGRDGSDIEMTASAYANLCTRFANALAARAEMLDFGFSEDSVFVWYVFEDGQFCTQTKFLRAGSELTVPGVEDAETPVSDAFTSFRYSDADFLYWTDGDGRQYYPGDVITLDEKTLTLYAVWLNE